MERLGKTSARRKLLVSFHDPVNAVGRVRLGDLDGGRNVTLEDLLELSRAGRAGVPVVTVDMRTFRLN